MQPDFWHERWQRNQIGFHQPEINPHLQGFWDQLGAAPGSRVFVPLCGKSSDMLWLRDQGFEVVGVEISPLAVRDFFRENDLQADVATQGKFELWEAGGIRIYCGDFFDLGPAHLDGVRTVYDRASLVALPPAMRRDYARHMVRLLAPHSRALLVTFEYAQEEMQGPPFSVQEPEVRALYGGSCTIELVHDADILEQESRFRERGMSALQEKVYLLTYNQGS